MRLRNRKGWRTGRTQPGKTEELAAQIERHGRQKRPKGNKHEIPMREARLKERNGSGERFHQQVQGQANSHTNHLGNKAKKDGGMIRDSFPGINSPGQAPVEHAPGLSGSRTRLQWSFSGARTGLQWRWAGVVRSSPWPSPTFSENSGKLSSPSQNSGSHLPEILGFLHHRTAAFAGAPITPREEAGSVSCDSAACGG